MKKVILIAGLIIQFITNSFSQTVDQAYGVWYWQTGNFTSKDTLKKPLENFEGAMNILPDYEVKFTPGPSKNPLIRQSLQGNYMPGQKLIKIQQKAWYKDTLKLETSTDFDLVSVNSNQLVLKRKGNNKPFTDSIFVFRKLKAFDIDTIIRGKKWINTRFSYDNLQRFELLPGSNKNSARPNLVWDLSKEEYWKNQFGERSGYSGKTFDFSVKDDSTITVHYKELPETDRTFHILYCGPNGFAIEEKMPKMYKSNQYTYAFQTPEELQGEYQWQKPAEFGTMAKIKFDKDYTFHFEYKSATGNLTQYSGMYNIYIDEVFLFPNVYSGDENISWGTRYEDKKNQFYVGEPLKMEISVPKANRSVDLITRFVGDQPNIILQKK